MYFFLKFCKLLIARDSQKEEVKKKVLTTMFDCLLHLTGNLLNKEDVWKYLQDVTFFLLTLEKTGQIRVQKMTSRDSCCNKKKPIIGSRSKSINLSIPLTFSSLLIFFLFYLSFLYVFVVLGALFFVNFCGCHLTSQK